MEETFRKIAAKVSSITGSFWGFGTAFIIILLWLFSGPFFGFSEIWQIFINTGTTVITFLMVFLIQNSANRDSKSIHLKLDELLLSKASARNEMINVEERTEEEIKELDQEFKQKATQVDSNSSS